MKRVGAHGYLLLPTGLYVSETGIVLQSSVGSAPLAYIAYIFYSPYLGCCPRAGNFIPRIRTKPVRSRRKYRQDCRGFKSQTTSQGRGARAKLKTGRRNEDLLYVG